MKLTIPPKRVYPEMAKADQVVIPTGLLETRRFPG